MALLIIGIVVFLGIHLLPTFGGLRERLIERLGANVQPKDLGKGISEALVTTLLGLAVAIPTLSAYIIFRNKVQRIIADATVVVGELMDRFRPTE